MGFFRQSHNTPAVPEGKASLPQPTKPVVTVNMGGVHAELSAGDQLSGRQEVAGVDVVFAFDTTGSMSGFIDGLVSAMSSFVDVLQDRGLDWRTTCVPFGDLLIPGDRVVSTVPWVTSVAAARSQLQSMPRFNGGGNFGESSYEAVAVSLKKKFRHNAIKIVILITDDEPHQHKYSTSRIIAQLVEADALCFSVSHATQTYTKLVNETGGTLIPISSSVNISAIVDAFLRLANDLAQRSKKIHELGNGSPQKLLEIERK